MPHSPSFKARTIRLTLLAIIPLLIMQFALNLFSTPTSVYAQTFQPPANPYGVNTFLEKEVEDWKKERTFQMIQEAGVGWIKQHFPWEEIETKKGYFTDDKFNKSSWQKFDQIVDLAARYKVNIVARLDRTPLWAQPANNNPQQIPAKFQDYADFVKAFVTHYKGKINYIQIWNEPNLGSEWNGTVDAKRYVELLKLASEAAKSVDPNIKIMTAPLAMNIEKGPTNLNELDFLRQMYTNGAKPYFDIVAANGYGLDYTPEDAPTEQKLNFRRVELLRKIMEQNGDNNKQVWFNEYGWNASPENFPKDKLIWRRVTEQQQADYTVRGIEYARKNYPWAGVLFVWYFRQVGDIDASRSDYYFQMVTTDFKPKPVYDAVKKNALTFLAQQGQPTPVPQTPAQAPTTTAVAAATTTAPKPTTVAGATTVTQAQATTRPNNTPATTVASVSTPSTTGNSSDNGGGGGLIFIIIGGVLVLAAGGGVGYYMLQNRNRR